MKYKLAPDGKSILVDEKGLPIVINDKEEEFGIDAIHLYGKIPSLQEEAKQHRLKAKDLQVDLDKFKNITDPEKALEALRTVEAMTAKSSTEEEKLNKIKTELEAAWKMKLENTKTAHQTELEERNLREKALEGDIYKALSKSAFSSSKYFSGSEPITNLRPDIARAYFGNRYKVETVDDDRVLVGLKKDGSPIMSKSSPGEFASFDESMTSIIDEYEHREDILQSSKGSRSRGGVGRYSGQTVAKGDNKGFLDNLDKIASGQVTVS